MPPLTVEPPTDGPCSTWAEPKDCTAYGFLTVDGTETDVLALHLVNASKVLYRATAQLYPGTCSLKIRPVSRDCLNDQQWWNRWEWGVGGWYGPWADFQDGVWFNGPLCGCPDPLLPYDGGHRIPRVDLGAYPVTEITEVLIDGVAFDPANFRLDQWQYLVRTDGERWPLAEDVGLDDTEVGTWSIAVKYGQPVPTDGVAASAELASELFKAHAPNAEDSRLPLHVTAISRSGVTYNIADVLDIVKGGNTGLYFVDLFVNSVNPHRLDRPPRVLSPDIHPARTVGSPPA